MQSSTPDAHNSPMMYRSNKYMKKAKRGGFQIYIFKENLSLYHGTIANTSDKGDDKLWVDNIINNRLDVAFNRPLFLSNKQTADAYGTGVDKTELHLLNLTDNEMQDDVQDKNVIPLFYVPKPHGVTLQFKVVKDICLFDIGNVDNMRKLWNMINSMQLNELQQYWSYVFRGHKYYDDNMIKNAIYTLLTRTCVQDRGNTKNIGNLIPQTITYSKRKPRQCNRQSKFDTDQQLTKFLCTFLHQNNINVDGWVFFQHDLGGKEVTRFHSEVMLCNPSKSITFKKAHYIPDTVYMDIPTRDEFFKSHTYFKKSLLTNIPPPVEVWYHKGDA